MGEEVTKNLQSGHVLQCMNKEMVSRRKLNYEIRKRVELKNNDKFSIRKIKNSQVQIINKENLITFTSQTSRKYQHLPINSSIQPKTQPISYKQSHSKLQLNIFNKNDNLRQTLGMISKDNWKKKYSLNKQEKVGQRRLYSIFQRPLSIDL